MQFCYLQSFCGDITHDLKLKILSVESLASIEATKILHVEFENTTNDTVFIPPFNEEFLSTSTLALVDTNVAATIIIPELDSALGKMQSYGISSPDLFNTAAKDNFANTPLSNNHYGIGYCIAPKKTVELKIILRITQKNYYNVDRTKIKNGIKLALRIDYYKGSKYLHNVELVSESYYDLNRIFDYINLNTDK